jgi:acetyltransferase-like isoleucine patch superfamily enzyme
VRDAVVERVVLEEVPGTGLRRWIRFVWRNRMYTPRYWVLGARYLWRFKLRNRHVVTRGMVFVARTAEIRCRRGLGHLEIGRWVWIGSGNAVRCHEGFMRIGDKTVFGSNVTVDGYLDVDIGPECLVAEGAYVTDYDHEYRDPAVPIRKQGIVKSPTRIGGDCWVGQSATILRGSNVGRGSVIGARSVVRGEVPSYSVVAGNPARVVKRRSG